MNGPQPGPLLRFREGYAARLNTDYETTDRYHAGLEYRFDEYSSLEIGYSDESGFTVDFKQRL